MEFTILVNFHGHHYYMFSLSGICQGVEKKIFKDLMHFHYMTKVATPNIGTPNPGVMKTTVLV